MNNQIKCAFCQEAISVDAEKCPYCAEKTSLIHIGSKNIIDTPPPLPDNNEQWYYEVNGKQIGPKPFIVMQKLIEAEELALGTRVWKAGMPDWVKLEESELSHIRSSNTPPPLRRNAISNTLAWFIALSPWLGTNIEGLFARMEYPNDYEIQEFLSAIANHEFWYASLAAVYVLLIFDLKQLKKAGYSMDDFGGIKAYFIPYYLYKRAQVVADKLAYFIVWIVLFTLFYILP